MSIFGMPKYVFYSRLDNVANDPADDDSSEEKAFAPKTRDERIVSAIAGNGRPVVPKTRQEILLYQVGGFVDPGFRPKSREEYMLAQFLPHPRDDLPDPGWEEKT